MAFKDLELKKQYHKQYNKTYDQDEENRDRRNALRRKRRNQNKKREKELRRKYSLKRNYGIDQEEYEKLLESQNYRCAICETSDPKGNKNSEHFHIDHDHQSGKIRGLLCSSCNLGIGKLQDSTDLIRKALIYLESNQVEPNRLCDI